MKGWYKIVTGFLLISLLTFLSSMVIHVWAEEIEQFKLNKIREEIKLKLQEAEMKKEKQLEGLDMETKANVKENKQQKKEKIIEKFSENKKRVIKKYFILMEQRINKTIEKLTKKSEEILSQLLKLEAKKIEVSSLRAKLLYANAQKDTLSDSINEAKIQMEKILNGKVEKDTFNKVREQIENITKKLKLIQSNYQEIINGIAIVSNK